MSSSRASRAAGTAPIRAGTAYLACPRRRSRSARPRPSGSHSRRRSRCRRPGRPSPRPRPDRARCPTTSPATSQPGDSRLSVRRALGRTRAARPVGPVGDDGSPRVVEDVDRAGQQVAMALEVGAAAGRGRASSRRSDGAHRPGLDEPRAAGARRSRRDRCRRRPSRVVELGAQGVERVEERVDPVDEDLRRDRAGARPGRP